MTGLDPSSYEGREQTLVKHEVLRGYLEKLAYKAMRPGGTLNYIDGFAGPWQHSDEMLLDTSPHIALKVLHSVRDHLRREGQPGFRVRAMFVEKSPEKRLKLAESLKNEDDVIVKAGEFEQCIDEAVRFASGGDRPFAFTFIDPCGWTGFGLSRIRPLLRVERSEVLINFMTDKISRFIDSPNPVLADTFKDLFGTVDVRERWSKLHGQERERAIVSTYCERIRTQGCIRFVAPAVVLNPQADRTHYHLIYGTRHPEGLRVFRDAEARASRVQREARAGAKQRKRRAKTGQGELFGAEAMDTSYVEKLQSESRGLARQALLDSANPGQVVDFDKLALVGMHFPLVTTITVSDLLVELREEGDVEEFLGLSPGGRKPIWKKLHRIRWRR